MSKFKVGDKVKCLTSIHKFIGAGETATVTGVKGINMKLDCFQEGISFFPYAMSQFELAWQPSPGEMIEVSDISEVWPEREFVAMDKDLYLCRNLSYKGEYCAWQHARPIKKTHTITLEDGTKVELSEESYQNLKDGINN